MTSGFVPGDIVRADLPDETDLDHDRYHGRTGEVVELIRDDAGMETGDERDSVLYRIRFDNGEIADLRWRDLRPR